MRPRCFLIYMVTVTGVMVGCEVPSTRQSDEAAIRSVMDAQSTAWNAGDIAGFMEGYMDSACFISSRGRTCGRAAVTASYRQHYPDKASMGLLDFSDLEILPAGPSNAWCTGRWRLLRSADTLSGGFSLFWQRTPQGWRILRDHTY